MIVDGIADLLAGWVALAREPWFAAAALVAAGILGLAVGSFLNVVIHRVPRMMDAQWRAQCAEFEGRPYDPGPRFDLVVPASHCPACGHALRLRDNIPLLSWLWLRGACGFCGARISARYPAVEAFTSVLSVLVIAALGPNLAGLAGLVLTWTLIGLAFIDADTTFLPDSMTLPLLWLGLLLNLHGLFVPLADAVIGAMAGYLSLWSIYWVFKLITGKEGMGYGDFKLLAALGAWLGWQMLLPVILLSSLVGAVIGIGLIVLARRGREVPIPFGPYLAGAGYLALVFRTELRQLLPL